MKRQRSLWTPLLPPLRTRSLTVHMQRETLTYGCVPPVPAHTTWRSTCRQDTCRHRYADTNIMCWLVIYSDGFSAEQKATLWVFSNLVWLKSAHDTEKSHNFAFWNVACYEKHTHFFSQSREKEDVDLLYYDNLKTVSDIVLTQEHQTFALLACSIRAYYFIWDFGVYFSS